MGVYIQPASDSVVVTSSLAQGDITLHRIIYFFTIMRLVFSVFVFMALALFSETTGLSKYRTYSGFPGCGATHSIVSIIQQNYKKPATFVF